MVGTNNNASLRRESVSVFDQRNVRGITRRQPRQQIVGPGALSLLGRVPRRFFRICVGTIGFWHEFGYQRQWIAGRLGSLMHRRCYQLSTFVLAG
eukprot:4692208-Pleurochrysis_carterae.AAC.1